MPAPAIVITINSLIKTIIALTIPKYPFKAKNSKTEKIEISIKNERI